MGEMRLHLDDALHLELLTKAQGLGIDSSVLAVDLVRRGLGRRPRSDRAAVARELLGQQPARPDADSSIMIREDRDTR